MLDKIGDSMNIKEFKNFVDKVIDQRDLLFQILKRYEKEIEVQNKKIDVYKDISKADDIIIEHFEERSKEYWRQMLDSMS